MTEAPVLPVLQRRFRETEASMNRHLVERGPIIRTALLALVAKQHCFYLGPPGVAKSHTVRILHQHIADLQPGDWFERLLTAFMPDSEIVGGPDLLALEQGVTRKVVTGTLVTARLAFLDEMFKASGPLLNALLKILNEREFDNGPEVVQVPLWSMFAASNELPQGDCEALADRIGFWHIVNPIIESGNFVRMLAMSGAAPTIDPTLTLSDIVTAQRETTAVAIDPEVLDSLNTLRLKLREEGIEPTDRRWASTLHVIRAQAWWEGRDKATIDDMTPLQHMLWRDPNQIRTVATQVLQLASPLELEARELLNLAQELATANAQCLGKRYDNRTARNHVVMELHRKMEKCCDDIMKLQERLNGRTNDTLAQAKSILNDALDRMVREGLQIDTRETRS